MDVTLIFGSLGIVFYLFLMPFVGGWSFFLGGINALADYNPEFDELKKKHTAILDIILGSVLLLFFNGLFWFVVWPLVVSFYNLNLPIFSW
jgi:hypothetical protein